MWNDFESKEFTFADRKAIIVYPSGTPNGKMLLKLEYLGAFPGFDIAMLERGYHLIFLYHQSRWAPDVETDITADFVRYCAKELNCSSRCILEGMSCGGLQAARLAQLHPELVASMYLDNPVLNILSMAGLGACEEPDVKQFWREIVDTFGVNRSTIINFRNSPIDHMQSLIDNDIPVIMIHGNADTVVIYEENGKVLEDFYKEKGGRLLSITRSMGKHHPHGLDDPTPIINFVEQN